MCTFKHIFHFSLSLSVSTVVYICGPLDTFLLIMKLFQEEEPHPEDYAIFYLDVFGASLKNDAKIPWSNSSLDGTDPINTFKVITLKSS